ncbi:ABC-2 type transport system permease protein [Williamsia limnetica]|uniref:Transport permease protein n=1 Tax=Williamsia limnetica TaxID=882452 RepID=A0A318RL51_WILLI|nr:ABC transporter permease [Williamsia limnetica]PYE16812.1 ABC-2 type transport system permease protein [Williamsia limnetica]
MSQAQAAPPDVHRRRVGLGTQSAVHAIALLRAWSRDPAVVVQAVVFPAFLLVMFQLVLGETVTAMGGGDSVYGNVGLVALVGTMFGTISTGLSLTAERESGLLGRLWTLPVPRIGFITGRMLAEIARTGIGTIVLFVVAIPMGFRFEQGVALGVAAIGVAMLCSLGWAVLVVALATVSSGKQIVTHLGALFLLMLFFNSGFVPVTEYPGWLQPVVRYQPMSPAIDTMSGLTAGGAIAAPLALTLLWVAGMTAVFGGLAVRGYRRAAENS